MSTGINQPLLMREAGLHLKLLQNRIMVKEKRDCRTKGYFECLIKKMLLDNLFDKCKEAEFDLNINKQKYHVVGNE